MSDISEFISLSDDPDPDVRGRVAVALGTMTGDSAKEALTTLVGMLVDTDERVTAAAIRSLGDLRDPNAIEPMMPILETGSTILKCQVLASMAHIGDSRAFAPVITRVFDTNELVRGNAASAVGALRDPRALEPLLMCLTDDSAQVRANACWSLGKIGCTQAVDRLISIADSNDAESIRANAAGALVDLGSDSRLTDDEDIKLAITALNHALDILGDTLEASKVRCAALIGFAQNYVEVFERDFNTATRALEMIFYLASNNEDEDEDLKSSAIWALGKVGSKKNAESLGLADETISNMVLILKNALKLNSSWCVKYAVEALGEIGGVEAFQIIKDFSDRCGAGEVASEVGSPKELTDLCKRAIDHLAR